jgi:hypothetical protein
VSHVGSPSEDRNGHWHCEALSGLTIAFSTRATGMRGRSAATIAFYGPDANRASKVVVGIVASEHAEVGEMRDWKLDAGDVRNDPRIAKEMLEFMARHGVLSVAMTDRIIGCPHRPRWHPVGRASDLHSSGLLPGSSAGGGGEEARTQVRPAVQDSTLGQSGGDSQAVDAGS